MTKKRNRYSSQFEFQVALDAAKGLQTTNELASEHGLHPNQASQWKRQLMEESPSVFSSRAVREQRQQDAADAELFEQIGRLKMELEWLTKKLPGTVEAMRSMIEPFHEQISIRRQRDLVGLNRSTLYHQPVGESESNLHLIRLIDEQYTKTPFYGWPRMTAHLRRQGYEINHKRIQRLMQKMGLQAVYPKPRSTIRDKEQKVYPYLLRGMHINRPNQVWGLLTSPMCVGGMGSCTLWPSWIGPVATCWPGNCQIP